MGVSVVIEEPRSRQRLSVAEGVSAARKAGWRLATRSLNGRGLRGIERVNEVSRKSHFYLGQLTLEQELANPGLESRRADLPASECSQ